jgi:hypothetical protein
MYDVIHLTLLLATEVKKEGNMLLKIITRLPASHIIRPVFFLAWQNFVYSIRSVFTEGAM